MSTTVTVAAAFTSPSDGGIRRHAVVETRYLSGGFAAMKWWIRTTPLPARPTSTQLRYVTTDDQSVLNPSEPDDSRAAG